MKVTSFLLEKGKVANFALPEIKHKNKAAILLFAPSHLSSEQNDFLAKLRQEYNGVAIHGCSTAGEIAGKSVSDDTISVAIIEFDTTMIKVASAPIAKPEDSFSCGQSLVSQLEPNKLRAVLILSDGLSCNGSALVDGINSKLPSGVIVSGGLAGDGSQFKSTWVLHNGEPRSHWVTALALYGDDLELYSGSQGGWDYFGPERVITKSKDNVVFEIDNEPALALYKRYLGEKANELPASGLLFPLQFKPKNSNHKPIVRTILAVDEVKQSITFAGNVPEGAIAQLMKANFDRLIDGAANSALCASEASGEGLVLAVSCVGRKLLLGERIDEEVEATLEKMPKGTTQLGFYSYGEISPAVNGSHGCDLHNQTMTLTFMRERKSNAA